MGYLVQRSTLIRRAQFLAVVVAMVATSCAAGKVGRAELARDDAHQIRMPGAVELAHVGNGRRSTIEGEQEPFDGFIFGTQSSAEDVRAYYSREVARLGWRPDDYQVFAATTEMGAWGWCKPAMRARLSIVRPTTYGETLYGGRTFATTFDARLIGRDPQVKCPRT